MLFTEGNVAFHSGKPCTVRLKSETFANFSFENGKLEMEAGIAFVL